MSQKVIVRQNRRRIKTSIKRVFVELDNAEAKQKLYNWMTAKGYSVTSSMTILQMVRILVAETTHRFKFNGEKLEIIETDTAAFEGNTMRIIAGAHFSGDLLVLE